MPDDLLSRRLGELAALTDDPPGLTRLAGRTLRDFFASRPKDAEVAAIRRDRLIVENGALVPHAARGKFLRPLR